EWSGRGAPRGIVAGGGGALNVAAGTRTARRGRFMLSPEDGGIVAWDAPMTTAVTVLGPSSAAVYKGLAIGSNSQGTFLYAANFRAGTGDVCDTSFHHVTLAGPFSDRGITGGFAARGVGDVRRQVCWRAAS